MRRFPGLAGLSLLATALAVLALELGPAAVGAWAQEPPAEAKKKAARTNRLARETSPYLLLHASNPVDWYPWGPEAFARAKAETKPIFLSVGYSSCYWCHVMERESFSDEAIARVLNANFVCVKVDREERPDIDQVYMTALQAFGNGGGWPMSMFLTPDGRPFFGGTYFPPRDREGLEGFMSLLDRVTAAWRDHRAELEKDANEVAAAVRRDLALQASRRVPLSRSFAQEARIQLAEQFDAEYGGFGYDPQRSRRPKFPEPSNLLFLLDQQRRSAAPNGPAQAGPERGAEKPPSALSMVLTTLDHLARGGIRDQLAGGFHRYSTERTWTVPHFEKMLYDNAQLASAYLLAYEMTGDRRWSQEAQATFQFVARTMTSPEGGFYSALDAETEGEEGRFYLWTRDEVQRVLGSGEDYRVFARVYGLDREPTFDHQRYVLFQPRPLGDQARDLGLTSEQLAERLAPSRASLLHAREQRRAPLRDDKVLTAWNGLMIAAYAEGFRVLKDDRYRQAAEKAADFALAKLRTADGRLMRTYRAGQARVPGYLDDYAFLVHGLLRLHAATKDPRRLAQARELTDRMIAGFADAREGGFFYTSGDHESLLARPKDPYDNVLPSGNSVAIRNLVALARETGEPKYLDHADRALRAFSPVLARAPTGAPLMLVALEEYLDARPQEPGESKTNAGYDPHESLLSAIASVSQPASVAPGRGFDAAITLTIKDGWHLAANPPRSETLNPTVLELPAGQGARLTGVDYPVGELKALASSGSEKVAVYEGTVRLTAHLRLDPDIKPGTTALKFKVRYQACNDRSCRAPATMTVPLEVKVQGP